ncbi:MAG: glycosyltransferase family 39 protein [Candidatus Doudnabacteria bacterium]|nr:glycosyltransferase family 39 protein [Candidatus Doudnabacteria bacterium]
MSTIFLILALLSGAALRFYHATGVALWYDEAFSALFLRYPWREMLYQISLDVHPPLYYIVLRLWAYVAGQSLFGLRLLSIIFGILTVWAGYRFALAAFKNKKIASLAAILLAVNPFQVQYALEMRMYALGMFLIMLSSFFLVRALETEARRKKLRFWAGFVLASTAALYTHYYLLFSVGAQALYLLCYFLKKRRLKILFEGALAYCSIFFLYLAWVPVFLVHLQNVQGGYWIPPMDRWSVPGTFWKIMFGDFAANHATLAISAIAVLVLTAYFLKKNQSFHKWLIFLNILIPVSAAIVFSLKTSLYLDRYFVFVSLYFSILIAAAFWSIPRFFVRWLLITALILASLLAFFRNWQNLDIEHQPGMAAAASYINANAKSGELLYGGSSYVLLTFRFYNQTGIKPLLISSQPLGSRVPLYAPEDVVLGLAQTKPGGTVWLFWTTGFGGVKPTIPKNWKLLDEQRFKDTPSFKGEIFIDKYLVK